MRFSLFFTLTLFFACKPGNVSDVAYIDEDRIWQEYVIEYDENDSELFASATFRFAGDRGNTLVVDSSGEISFNGKAMKRAKYAAGSVFYKALEKNSNPAGKTHVFQLKTPDGEIIENTATLAPLNIIVPENIDVENDLVLNFDPATLQDSEILVIDISDTATSIKLSFSKHEIKGNKLTIKAKVLSAINGMEGTMSISRSGDFPLTRPFKEGGFIRKVYIQKNTRVKFIRKNAGT